MFNFASLVWTVLCLYVSKFHTMSLLLWRNINRNKIETKICRKIFSTTFSKVNLVLSYSYFSGFYFKTETDSVSKQINISVSGMWRRFKSGRNIVDNKRVSKLIALFVFRNTLLFVFLKFRPRRYAKVSYLIISMLKFQTEIPCEGTKFHLSEALVGVESNKKFIVFFRKWHLA